MGIFLCINKMFMAKMRYLENNTFKSYRYL